MRTGTESLAAQLECFYVKSGFYVPWVHFRSKGCASNSSAVFWDKGEH